MTPPIITLTTDFGLQDHYAGTMKGVILARCPNAQVVDITHEIEAFSILAGAYAISQAACYFPASTVHVVVIDPGVGTERKPVLAEANNQLFIAPDNGVLSLILSGAARAVVRELSNRNLWLSPPSTTFHGRDVFAAVAGALASARIRPEDVGTVVNRPLLLNNLEPIEIGRGHWRGIVLSVDGFGNIITNLKSIDFAGRLTGSFHLTAGAGEVTEVRETFSGVPDAAFVYQGSSGYLEIGVNQENAARRYTIRPGDSVDFRFSY